MWWYGDSYGGKSLENEWIVWKYSIVMRNEWEYYLHQIFKEAKLTRFNIIILIF